MTGKIILKRGKEKSLLRKHPWLFSGAIDKHENLSLPGETADIYGSDGRWLARGAYSPHSQIRARVFTFNKKESIDRDFFRERISDAHGMRYEFFEGNTIDAFRLINSESDGLPGLIVDRYNNVLVCQFLSAGAEFWKSLIVEELTRIMPDHSIYERSDTAARRKEGLETVSGLLSGNEPPEFVEIREKDCRFLVDVRNGHKTGFYLDQRENRVTVSESAKNKNILNCFAYSGAFGVHCLMRGAKSVVNIETSPTALELARKNIELNKIGTDKVEFIKADVFESMRRFREENRKFDMIVLDPPKFAESAAQINKAARGYKDINMLGFQLLNKGGLLFTFSCSGHVGLDLFQKIVASAALDAGGDVQITKFLGQSSDHPVSANFPEGMYLKGLACRRVQ